MSFGAPSKISWMPGETICLPTIISSADNDVAFDIISVATRIAFIGLPCLGACLF